MLEIHHNCLFANPADFVESDSSTRLLRQELSDKTVDTGEKTTL